MDNQQFFKRVGKLRTESQRRINDTYIWCSLAMIALRHALSDDYVLNQQEFAVPSSSHPNRTVAREPEKVKNIISSAVNRELYSSVLVYVVAQIEAYLNDVISLVLRFDNRRLKTAVRGVESVKSIEIGEVVDSLSKDDVIERIIEKIQVSLFYAKPEIQFDYFVKVLGVEINDALKGAWIELKATRDLIVHNSGIINDVYVQKCGDLARGQLDELITIDKKYFEESIGTTKSLIGQFASQLQRLNK